MIVCIPLILIQERPVFMTLFMIFIQERLGSFRCERIDTTKHVNVIDTSTMYVCIRNCTIFSALCNILQLSYSLVHRRGPYLHMYIDMCLHNKQFKYTFFYYCVFMLESFYNCYVDLEPKWERGARHLVPRAY